MMAVKIDSSGATAATPDKGSEIIPPRARPMDDAVADGVYASSLVLAAEAMLEDLRDRYGVEPWMQAQIDHIKNVLTVAGKHIGRSVDIVDDWESLLMQTRGQA